MLSSCGLAFRVWTPTGETPDQSGTKIINNLYNCVLGNLVTGENAPEFHHNGDYDVDGFGWPTAGSGAIDGGVEISPYTDGYQGLAPDIGCYEAGTWGWGAGANWTQIP